MALAASVIALTVAGEACRGRGCRIPAVINTWGFTSAAEKAWDVLRKTDDALTAVELGCAVCEEERCDGTVGWGGQPDTNGETTLDAMLMDGSTMKVGAVGALRRVKSVISVARKVLEHTSHTLLVGDQATEFAVSNFGYNQESLTSDTSRKQHEEWLAASCQPNFFIGMANDTASCPPYHGAGSGARAAAAVPPLRVGPGNHDTIGMVAVDSEGRVRCGTSTNGLRHKIAGRVGDSPIAGAGAYCDDEVGGAAATGDGDVMMRFLPTFYTVELMRQGKSPTKAAEEAILRIVKHYPAFTGSIVAMANDGTYGAATYGYTFPVSVASRALGGVRVEQYPPVKAAGGR
eukprot:TRINITY_DN40353_c0_g1_i1.p1 TRINITY_DN40353_c0_g1~~TRINITY_DN40353_c0_g1_i1.p1  ORF type:complete len:367 (+),score=115.97 TRINITY_DN40353_c0_g1_i1:63-1103(+)